MGSSFSPSISDSTFATSSSYQIKNMPDKRLDKGIPMLHVGVKSRQQSSSFLPVLKRHILLINTFDINKTI